MNDALDPCAFAEEWVVETEEAADAPSREQLLDRVMGPERFLKSSEMLRKGRSPSTSLALVARQRSGRIVGTVRLWDILAGDTPSLLLGPLAVDKAVAGNGIGSALIHEAIARARRLGHGSIILVGDPAYYARFGFRAELTSSLSMPGDFVRKRLLALELRHGGLTSARGLITATQDDRRILAA